MATKFSDLLGETLLQARTSDQTDESFRKISTHELDDKVIGLYFSAHWCGPCRAFTPVLAKHYTAALSELHDRFEIVFVSSDKDETSFKEYFLTMPWKALPYSERSRATKLGEKFQVEGIPTLIILSADGKILNQDGTDDIREKGVDALQAWSKGGSQAADGHKWVGVSCKECQMNPLVGQRFYCSTCDDYDICSTCEKKGHPHELKLMPQKLATIGNLVWKGINLD